MAESKETIRDRFRNLLNLNRSNVARVSQTAGQPVLTHEFWLDIGASTPLETRLEKLKDASKLVETEFLNDSIIKKFWMETKDLLQPKMTHDVRVTELAFVRSIIKGQYRQLGILRAVFFEALKDHNILEDAAAIVQTFETLSDNGKDIALFEQEVGSLLLKWMKTMKGNTKLLTLLINVIKFNSSYLDQDAIMRILSHICYLCSTKSPEGEMELALQVVEAVLCYSSLPYESLYAVTIMLCHVLNLKEFCNKSWELMRKLLGTHLGHSCVCMMCDILQDPKMLFDWPLLRSAVFFIGMGLWGSVRVKSLKHTPQSVLPSFLYALQTKNLELAFEVTLTMQRLVRKFGHELQVGTWDHVLDIVSVLLELLGDSSEQQLPAALSLKTGTHDLITFIEKLYNNEVYDGSIEQLFILTERCSSDRSDESVFLLISYKAQLINPMKQNWITNLLMLMETFYARGSRTAVRLRTLKVLWSVVETSMNLYEEELVAEIMIPCFCDLHEEHDLQVKTKAIQTVVKSCLLSSEFCLDLLALLKKVLDYQCTASKLVASPWPQSSGDVCSDAKELVLGLATIFRRKFAEYPGTHSAETFRLICSFLRLCYSADTLLDNHSMVESRKEAIDLLLSLRVNGKGQLAIQDGKVSPEENCYTVYLLATFDDQSAESPDGVGHINCRDIMGCFLMCLKQETSWVVLETALKRACILLQNKSIIVGCNDKAPTRTDPASSQLDDLAKSLCSMMSDTEFARRKLTGLPVDFTKAAVQDLTLSVLLCVVSYHRWLEVSRQRQILRCLESGFTSHCSRQCVAALTLCLAEMPQDTLLRVLPSVLLRLSQMSATVLMATAVLGLLATLAQLPQLYSNFVEDQYMSVFMVALQYTNPSKFSRYVVSLAHHIIGTWFAKCRMSFRPDFVRLITKHLHAANRRGTKAEDGSDVDLIRNDLMETCIDTMARYTFSNCSTPPRRSALARFLFGGAPSCTWLVGNKLITVTTSNIDVTPEKIRSLEVPLPPSTPSSTFWPKPSKRSFDVPMSLEAPAKLQADEISSLSSSPKQRHKSGSAVMRHSLHLSPYETRTTKPAKMGESVRQRLDFKQSDYNEAQPKCLAHGWAEIYIRRPSGNTAWSMRIQNQFETMFESGSMSDFLNFQPLLEEIKGRNKPLDEPLTEEVTEEIHEPQQARNEYHSNEYLDLTMSGEKKKPAARDDSAILEERTLEMSPQSSTLPPTHSMPGPVRQRSHTVSTSKDCAVEAAAMSAKRAAELKRSQVLATEGLAGPTQSVIQHTSEKWDSLESSLRHQRSGIISPCFVFLQLFQSAVSTESIHRPILVKASQNVDRAIQVLDRIPPYDTWATGVVYVGRGEGADGAVILANVCGSPRYQEFLHGLGELVCLTDCDPSNTFLKGLDTSGEDGEFTYVWKEDILQMVFHVATLMPNKSSDAGSKRRHIGNDYVLIAYDNDGGRYVPGCVVKGQFRSAEVVVTPLDHGTNHVRYVFHRSCVEQSIGSSAGPWLVSDQSLPIFVRQLALHASMAAFVCLGEGGGAGEYTSKALARLKQIRRIRSKVIQGTESVNPVGPGAQRHPRSEHAVKDGDSLRECHRLEEFSDYVAL